MTQIERVREGERKSKRDRTYRKVEREKERECVCERVRE